jgi:hypothetical protein
MKPFWAHVKGGELAQGDLLPDCLIPAFKPATQPGPARRLAEWDTFPAREALPSHQ